MPATNRVKTDTAFNLAILGGMMFYLALSTAGFAIAGATGILPDMTANAQWLAIMSVPSGLVAGISLFLSKRLSYKK